MNADVGTGIVVTGLVASATPLVWAATGEYVAERAGTLNISLEGMMLAGAFTSIDVSHLSHHALLGVVAGLVAGFVVAAIHANFSHRLTANTFVVGLTLDALVLGLTDFFSGKYPDLAGPKVRPVAVPGLSHLPGVGGSLFHAPWLLYPLVLVVPVIAVVVGRTQWGLEVRACGEDPQAADSTGVRVNLRRRQALYLCGAMAGIGGAYLGLAVVGSFNQDMTDGIGYVAIAAVIFGGWTLWGTLLGCGLFGGLGALQLVLPAFGVAINGDLLISLPYVCALAAMTLLATRHHKPVALAQPFVRGVA